VVWEWQEAFYIGASDTTIQLLNHWFKRTHRKNIPDREEFEFRYYSCQREAIETLRLCIIGNNLERREALMGCISARDYDWKSRSIP
jgi:hypothetical protein